MNIKLVKYFVVALITFGGVAVHEGDFTPDIPKTWDDRIMASLEIPLVDAGSSAVHVSADYYYSIPVRPIYKSYPVYAVGKEPPGYEAWLKEQAPETVFDVSMLKTEADWIKAGEIVFDVANPLR